MGIHDGVLWEGYAARTAAPLAQNCAWLVHLHNLAFKRHSAGGGDYEDDPLWTAPLERALAAHSSARHRHN